MKMRRKILFFGSMAALYIVAIGTIGTLLSASHLFGSEPPKQQTSYSTPALPPKTISGKPVRISIPDSNIDLSVIDGSFDYSSQEWSVSEDKAQFAVMTKPANDRAGMTFIYGHGTDAVFGKIGTNRPPTGTEAKIFTDNGRVFLYSLSKIHDMKPEDTSILNDASTGPPRLVVQTCTGLFSEWRTMYVFSFKKVA